MLCVLRPILALGCGMLILTISYVPAMEAESPANHAPSSSPSLATAAVCQDDESGTSSQLAPSPPPPPSDMAGAREVAIREILELRHQQEDLFRGTLFDDMDSTESDKTFVQALRNVASQPSQQSDQATDPATVSGRSGACETAYMQPMQQQTAFQQTLRQSVQARDVALVSTLRQACRLLDGKANDLEDSHEYSEADQLRDLSSELRKQARRWADSVLLAPARQADRLPSLADPTAPQ